LKTEDVMHVPSERSRVESRSRISATAVVVGATVTLVVLSLLLELGGGLGLFRLPAGPILDAAAARDAGAGLAVWAALSWTGAAFVGAFVAAVIARSPLRRDGLLHGVATWAVACAAACVLSCIWLMSAISMDLVSRDLASVFWTRGALWSYVISDVLAGSAALAGGLLGARSETRAARSAEADSEREERAPIAAKAVLRARPT
jgi:hypothetical protein